MKTTITYIFLFLAVAFVSCQNDNESNIDDGRLELENEIIIANGKIQSPKWLIHIIDSIARSYQPSHGTNEYLSPWVFSVSHEDHEYIQVLDMFNSCYACGNLFFSTSGKPIIASNSLNAGLYEELSKEEDRTLIWREKFDTPETKAKGASVNVYTPYGSLVTDTYYASEDFSPAVKANILQELASQYPQAVVIGEATTTYNCHAYAWYITEGGSPVWMGWSTNPTNVYWMDGSYISTTAGSASKVAYLKDNHSAITTGTPDVFISKWGNWPLVRHPKNHSPYDASSLSYLRKNNIPPYYIGLNVNDHASGGSTIYASGGYAGTSVYAFNYKSTTPTSYNWSAQFNGSCDRWYIWPSGSKADISVYLNSQHSGGSLRIICEMCNGNTLLGTAVYYLSVYPR